MKHYDCHNQKVNLEQFYGASTQLELLKGIAHWWVGIYINNDAATIDTFKITFNDEDGLGSWGAEVYWSE